VNRTSRSKRPSDRLRRDFSSIAVARFESAQSHEQLGFGFALLLAERLRGARELRVVPPRQTLVPDERTPEEIGRASGVDVVFTGSLQVRGDALEVVAVLVDPLTEGETWSERYAVQCDDVLHVNRTLADHISAMPRRKSASGGHAWDAFCAYSAARWTDWFHGDLVRAARLYERAAVLAPSLTPAVAARACALMALIADGRHDREQLESVAAMAAMALRRDRSLPDAAAALGIALLLQGDARRAETYLRRAATLDPLCARAHHWLAEALDALGRTEDAAREREVFASALPRLYADRQIHSQARS